MSQTSEARRAGGAAGLKETSCVAADGSENTQSTAKRQAQISEEAREAARFLLREQIYESAERAIHYLDCLARHVAADDPPSISYCFAKFAAHGKVVVLGCREWRCPVTAEILIGIPNKKP